MLMGQGFEFDPWPGHTQESTHGAQISGTTNRCFSQINLKKYKEKKETRPICSVAGALAHTPKAPGLIPAGRAEREAANRGVPPPPPPTLGGKKDAETQMGKELAQEHPAVSPV